MDIAYIGAQWHDDIVGRAYDGFVAESAAVLSHATLTHFRVPGAFEMPLKAQRLARTGRYAAIVAAALVVDGGIYRHEFVADAVVSGLMRVQLDTDVPVFSVVLTPHHFHAGSEHTEFFRTHFVTKGAEAARAVAGLLSGG